MSTSKTSLISDGGIRTSTLQRMARTFAGIWGAKETYVLSKLASSADRRSPMRTLYDDIGDFMFDNKLDLTPLNFGCTHDYLFGANPDIVAEFGAAKRKGLISNGWIEDYVASHQASVVTPAALDAMVETIEKELNCTIAMAGTSASRAESFGDDLEIFSTEHESSTLTQRLLLLTREMITHTRLAELEMRACHARVQDLQITLRSARRASKTDALTGLYNRRGFEVCTRQALSQDDAANVVIAICDLDHFKAINDQFGHETGDRVLCYFARQLEKLARSGHQVARLGGEEFGILMTGQTLERAAREIHKIRTSMAGRTLYERQTQRPIGGITFSAGLAALSAADRLADALHEADAAMYAAKRNGRDQTYASYGRNLIVPIM